MSQTTLRYALHTKPFLAMFSNGAQRVFWAYSEKGAREEAFRWMREATPGNTILTYIGPQRGGHSSRSVA